MKTRFWPNPYDAEHTQYQTMHYKEKSLRHFSPALTANFETNHLFQCGSNTYWWLWNSDWEHRNGNDPKKIEECLLHPQRLLRSWTLHPLCMQLQEKESFQSLALSLKQTEHWHWKRSLTLPEWLADNQNNTAEAAVEWRLARASSETKDILHWSYLDTWPQYDLQGQFATPSRTSMKFRWVISKEKTKTLIIFCVLFIFRHFTQTWRSTKVAN